MFRVQSPPDQAFHNLASPSASMGLPLKSRAFDFDFFSTPEAFLADMKQPDAPASQTFAELLAWTGLQRPPLHGMTQVIIVSGNSLVAAGLAMRLAQGNTSAFATTPFPQREMNQGPSDFTRLAQACSQADAPPAPYAAGRPNTGSQKVALLEWGQPSPLLHSLFEMGHIEGLSELFANRCDLEHLIVSAKVYRPIPQLYVLGQGQLQPSWLLTLPKLLTLTQAFRRKFHRIVLSVPGIEHQLELARVLQYLQAPYALIYDPEDTFLRQSEKILIEVPTTIFQRLI